MKRKMFAILSIAVTLVFCMSLTFNSLAVTESDKKRTYKTKLIRQKMS